MVAARARDVSRYILGCVLASAVGACWSSRTSHPGGGALSSSAASTVVSTAFGAIPVDSICAAVRCRMIAVDLVVRRAPGIGPYQLARLPVETTLHLDGLVGTHRLATPVIAGAFASPSSGSDTVRLGFAIVEPEGRSSVHRTVLIPIEAPRTMGALAIVSLELAVDRSWRVVRVRIEEG